MSYGGNADPTGIQVTFLDQTGAKSVKAVIAFSVPVSRILPNIITKMNLPTTSPDGQPMSYSLDHKEGGRRLLESQTLVEAGVQNGDHLIVYPEVVAGRSLRPSASTDPSPSVDRPGIDRPCTNRPGIRRLRNDLAALERLDGGELGPPVPRPRASPSQHYLIEFHGQEPGAGPGQGRRPRPARGRDQARRVLPADHARDPLADADLPPEHLRDRHGLPRRLRHALGPQPEPRRALRDALGHGPVPQLRHPQPLQPRGRPLGRQPDDLPVPDRRPPAPRPPRRARAGRAEPVEPTPTPAPTPGRRRPAREPGSKAGRYAEFVRKFAADLRARSRRPASTPRPSGDRSTG